MRRDTLLDFFYDLAGTRGEFLVYDDGFRSYSFTYEQVGAAARGFAARLHASGLRKGDTVIFFSESRPEWVVAFWGCLLIGVVVVPIDYRTSPDYLIRVRRIVSARLIVVGEDVPPATQWGTEAQAWTAGTASGGAEPAVSIWELKDISRADASVPAASVGRDDVVEIIFTSGATAEPKGVVITHRNVLANIVPVEREVLKYRKWGRPFLPLRFLNLLPLSHMFGQAMATFVPPMVPGTVVFMRGYNPDAIVSQIRRRRVSVLISVPKILDVLREYVRRAAPDAIRQMDTGRKEHVAWRWWRYRHVHRLLGFKFWAFVVGAAPLEPELEAFWGELGFAVIQGYGLTETAPIVSLNHPFGTKRGSVGKAIAGVDVKIAPDGEILVKGENVTTGYFNAADETARAFEDGWFHTGDIGEIGEGGQLFIRGRKKEMIVTPEGLNVFPEDVERVLLRVPGVRDAAVVGARAGSESSERVHAVLVVDPGADVDAITRSANTQLADHQRIRRALVWPGGELPRTEGTKKLKRSFIQEWVKGERAPEAVASGSDRLTAIVARYAGRSSVSADTTLEELGLSSLERVELMVALEDTFQTRIDEGAFAGAETLEQLRRIVDQGASADSAPAEPVDFPRWNRSLLARGIRGFSLATWILPIARIFAWIRVEGGGNLDALDGPVIFAANHQSHLDTPVILAALPARLRYRTATAMAKEFFKAHFFPEEHGRGAWLTNSLNYYLAALFFNAFPLPQREAGARQTLRYIGEVLEDGHSVLIYPEGRRTDQGEIGAFKPGIGMIAAKLHVPVVPVRIHGLDQVLHPTWRMARPGRVRVSFGRPMSLAGDDYGMLAGQVETAVKAL